MPVEPPATGWIFGDPTVDDGPDAALDLAPADADQDELGHDGDQLDQLDDLVAIGADLEAGTLLEAYRHGLFPMPAGHPRDPMYWFSPVRRGVLRLEDLRLTRSLRRSCRDFEVRVDTAFDEVLAGCADPARSHGWITDAVGAAYRNLHRLGWAHSVEVWRGGELAGGLYGLAIGGLFAGESMFHRQRDASKAALVGLVELMGEAPGSVPRLIDVQWSTPHLASLGVTEISRGAYLAVLPALLALDPPPAFDDALDAGRVWRGTPGVMDSSHRM